MNPHPKSRLAELVNGSPQGPLALEGLRSSSRSDRRFDSKMFDESGPSLKRSKSIPIQNKMKRTPSELQLRQEEQMAEYRDYLMYSRIVSGISRQQHEAKDYRTRLANDMCLAHIIGTRNLSEEELKQFDRPDYDRSSRFMKLPSKTSLEPNSLKMFLEQSFQQPHEEEEMFMLEL